MYTFLIQCFCYPGARGFSSLLAALQLIVTTSLLALFCEQKISRKTSGAKVYFCGKLQKMKKKTQEKVNSNQRQHIYMYFSGLKTLNIQSHVSVSEINSIHVIFFFQTLAMLLSAIPLTARGPSQIMVFDIHALQERFYFTDNVIPR